MIKQNIETNHILLPVYTCFLLPHAVGRGDIVQVVIKRKETLGNKKAFYILSAHD